MLGALGIIAVFFTVRLSLFTSFCSVNLLVSFFLELNYCVIWFIHSRKFLGVDSMKPWGVIHNGCCGLKDSKVNLKKCWHGWVHLTRMIYIKELKFWKNSKIFLVVMLLKSQNAGRAVANTTTTKTMTAAMTASTMTVVITASTMIALA